MEHDARRQATHVPCVIARRSRAIDLADYDIGVEVTSHSWGSGVACDQRNERHDRRVAEADDQRKNVRRSAFGSVTHPHEDPSRFRCPLGGMHDARARSDGNGRSARRVRADDRGRIRDVVGRVIPGLSGPGSQGLPHEREGKCTSRTETGSERRVEFVASAKLRRVSRARGSRPHARLDSNACVQRENLPAASRRAKRRARRSATHAARTLAASTASARGGRASTRPIEVSVRAR